MFGVWPRLDLAVSTPFYDPKTHDFPLNAHVWSQYARTAARALITLLIVPAGIALLGKFLFPRRRMLIKAEAVLFLIGTLAVGPGLLTNTLLKDHWGRARPIDVTEFGGTDRFTPWWDPRGDCPNNCSFVAGEPAGAFWTMAPAALAPPQWRLLAYGARARLRQRGRRAAHRRRRAFFHRCRVRRRVHVSGHLGGVRPDLSLVAEAHGRQDRQAGRMIYSGAPRTLKISASCGLIGRLSVSPVGSRRRNHLL